MINKHEKLKENVLKLVEANDKLKVCNMLAYDLIETMIETVELHNVTIVDTLPEEFNVLAASFKIANKLSILSDEQAIVKTLTDMLQSSLESLVEKGAPNVHSFLLYFDNNDNSYTLEVNAHQ